MATSPTTSALGAVGDLGRPAATKAPARADNHSEKSSFSDVFQDAQGSRPEQQQRPAAEKNAVPQASRDDEKSHVTRARTTALSGNKATVSTATQPVTGKDLPLAGESLPVTLDQLLTEMSDDKQASASSDDEDKADSIVECVAAVSVVATPVVLPENSVTTAAAALAARSGQVAGDDGQPSAAVGDVTSAQKREIPAAAQALNASVALPGEISSVEALPTEDAVLVAAVVPPLSTPSAKEPVAKPASDKKAVETPATTTVVNTAAATASATVMPVGVTAPILPSTAPADENVAAESSEQGLTLEKIAGVKTARDKNAAALAVGDDITAGAAFTDNADAGIPSDTAVETERGSFRDTLKQLDSTLAPSTARSDTTSVSTARDSGLRQYLDSAATTAKVDVPVGKAGWSDAVAGKVMWMSSQNLSSAEIQMNPADLGPLSVRVSSHQDQTSIYFTSPHASVREALDQSLPRLREMMGNQGIQLQDVGVGGQGSMREQHAFSDSGSGGSRGRGAHDAEIDAEIGNVTRASTMVSRPGLLDAYA